MRNLAKIQKIKMKLKTDHWLQPIPTRPQLLSIIGPTNTSVQYEKKEEETSKQMKNTSHPILISKPTSIYPTPSTHHSNKILTSNKKTTNKLNLRSVQFLVNLLKIFFYWTFIIIDLCGEKLSLIIRKTKIEHKQLVFHSMFCSV